MRGWRANDPETPPWSKRVLVDLHKRVPYEQKTTLRVRG